jgi:hypothetical protein
VHIWSYTLSGEIKYFSNFGGRVEHFSLPVLDFDTEYISLQHAQKLHTDKAESEAEGEWVSEV